MPEESLWGSAIKLLAGGTGTGIGLLLAKEILARAWATKEQRATAEDRFREIMLKQVEALHERVKLDNATCDERIKSLRADCASQCTDLERRLALRIDEAHRYRNLTMRYRAILYSTYRHPFDPKEDEL